MDNKKITNWLNWQEWKSVVGDAYNEENDLNSLKRALNRIIAWETRDQNVPPALVCLKELLIAKLYQIDKSNASVEQIYWYQSTLAMNIVRFVNFITEPYQTNVLAKAIKTIALEIGLPDWIVNLRHNATHFSLPSVEVLENARDFLYLWLKERYVDTYKEVSVEKSMVKNVREYIQNIFVDYMNARYKTILMKSKNKSLKEKSQNLDEKVETVTNHFKSETFDTLVETGYLIPTKDQLNAIGIVPEEFIEEDRIEIPKAFLNIWMEFLAHCNQSNNLIAHLFQKLVDTYRTEADNLVQNDSLREKFLLSWILCLMKLNSYKNEKNKFAKFQFEYNFKKVLLTILKGKPGRNGLSFLKELRNQQFIKNHMDLSEFEKILNLTILITQEELGLNDQIVSNDDSSNQMETGDDLSIYTIEIDQITRFEGQVLNKNSRISNIPSDWKLIDENEWNHEIVKLGLVEGQTYESLDLDMSQLLNKKDKKPNSEFDISINEAFDQSEKQLGTRILLDKNINPKFIDEIRQNLIKNYWQF